MTELEQAGQLLLKGKYLAAEKIYSKLLKQNPQNGHAYLGMGNLALIAKRPNKAVTFLNEACHLLTNEPIPLIQLAKAFNQLHSEPDALTVLEYGIKVAPELPQMHYELAQQLLIMGNLPKAELCFRKVLKLGNEVIACFALLEISRLKKFDSTDDDVQLILSYLAKPKLSERQSTVLHYALGKVYDDLQNYEQAWEHFTHANKLQLAKSQFKTIELDVFYKKIKKLNTPQVLTKQRVAANNEITPIFIVGLPRTGSTLLEQMLSRHNNIVGAGEVPYLSADVADYIFSQTRQHYPDYLSELTLEQLNEAASIYLQRIGQHAQEQQYVIDKLPANYQSIGLIYKLLPNAKVINLQRNTADVALSVYKNYFAENEPYFCDLNEFEHYHSLYTGIMQHWHNTLPGFIYELSYEQLVSDPETTLRGVLDYCNIDWQEACIDQSPLFQPVNTLSSIQVRKPIYKSSTGKWKNYQKHLQFLLD